MKYSPAPAVGSKNTSPHSAVTLRATTCAASTPVAACFTSTRLISGCGSTRRHFSTARTTPPVSATRTTARWLPRPSGSQAFSATTNGTPSGENSVPAAAQHVNARHTSTHPHIFHFSISRSYHLSSWRQVYQSPTPRATSARVPFACRRRMHSARRKAEDVCRREAGKWGRNVPRCTRGGRNRDRSARAEWFLDDERTGR